MKDFLKKYKYTIYNIIIILIAFLFIWLLLKNQSAVREKKVVIIEDVIKISKICFDGVCYESEIPQNVKISIEKDKSYTEDVFIIQIKNIKGLKK